jgi:hypothetical protein
MRKLVYLALLVSLVATMGCAITNYPIITDDRGDYSGIIRTAHKAYVQPSAQTATIWNDGTDELFTLVYQNQYGDQKLYTFNNFDPTGATTFLEQTYCDWQFEGCEITRAWNPTQNDDDFDYEFFEDCSGARSLSLLVSYGTRIGECGDNIFAGDPQSKARLFSNLDTTTWHGGTAYLMPMRANNVWVYFTNPAGQTELMPIYGQHNLLLTDKIQLVVPMAPNARLQLNWIRSWVADNGPDAEVYIVHEGVTGRTPVRFSTDGLNYNATRF